MTLYALIYQKSLLFFLLLTTTISWSQVTPIVHFYNNNWQLVNPASVDKAFIFNEHRSINLQGAYRQQWIGLEGSPTFSLLSLEFLPNQQKANAHRTKWGLQILRDQTDALSNNGVYGNFSYYFPIQRGKVIHIGTTTGIVWHQLNNSRLNFSSPESDLLDNNFNYLDINIGIFYRHLRKLYIGISVPQTLSLTLNNQFNIGETLNNQRFYNLILGGFIQQQPYHTRDKNGFLIEPSLWIRYAPDFQFQTLLPNSPISATVNLRFHYQQKIWFGGGFGTNKLLNLEFGWNKLVGGQVYNEKSSLLKFGFNWQLPLGGITGFSGQGLEVRLAYAWE